MFSVHNMWYEVKCVVEYKSESENGILIILERFDCFENKQKVYFYRAC